jgi:hypothetical protein
LPNGAAKCKGELYIDLSGFTLIGYSIYLDAGWGTSIQFISQHLYLFRPDQCAKDNRCLLDEISFISGLQR